MFEAILNRHRWSLACAAGCTEFRRFPEVAGRAPSTAEVDMRREPVVPVQVKRKVRDLKFDVVCLSVVWIVHKFKIFFLM